jgi:hypothetical protein
MLQMLLLAMPEADEGPETAQPYLETFLDWLEELFYKVADEGAPGGDMAPLFVPELITLMPASLAALRADRQFERAREATVLLSDAAIRDHGLYGAQLMQKTSIINHWLERFMATPGRKLFEWLCKAIDNLLDSFLKALGIGDAIKEVKEAMLASLDWQLDDL